MAFAFATLLVPFAFALVLAPACVRFTFVPFAFATLLEPFAFAAVLAPDFARFTFVAFAFATLLVPFAFAAVLAAPVRSRAVFFAPARVHVRSAAAATSALTRPLVTLSGRSRTSASPSALACSSSPLISSQLSCFSSPPRRPCIRTSE